MSAVIRRLRREMRAKTSNRQNQRNAAFAVRIGTRSFMVTLALLLQAGGQIEIDAATIDRVNLNMEFETVDHPEDPTKKIIRLVVADTAPVSMPAVD